MSQQPGRQITNPAALQTFSSWQQTAQDFAISLRECSSIILNGCLDQLVGWFLTGDGVAYVDQNLQAVVTWNVYLTQQANLLQGEWNSFYAQQHLFTPAEVMQATTTQQTCSTAFGSLQLVLSGLTAFFWNVKNETSALNDASEHAVWLEERATRGGKANTLALPNLWTKTTLLQGVQLLPISTVIVTHQGQLQHVNVTAGDIEEVRALAAQYK